MLSKNNVNNKLKNMKRQELLELLLEAYEENEKLRIENVELKTKLESKMYNLKTAGSIAEAALKLNDIFNVAQQAADDYLKNIKESKDIITKKEDSNENIVIPKLKCS